MKAVSDLPLLDGGGGGVHSATQVIVTLLPFAALFCAFLIFKLDALRASFAAMVVELVAVFAYYRMSPVQSAEASLWGILSMWSGFFVLYAGHLFGQVYRSTGLLEVLLESVQSILPSSDQKGRAVALVAIVGGFVGAFNGFATYPVTIPGLVELGFDGLYACSSYLVYFSWTLPFNSLFIAPTISNAASHVPIVEIVRVAGLLSIPLVFLSVLGFLKVLGWPFLERKSQELFWIVGVGNSVAIILFTQVWPDYYIVMLVAGAALSLGGLYVYGRMGIREAALSVVGADRPAAVRAPLPASVRFRAYAPLLLGVVIVILTKIHAIREVLERTRFGIEAWGYNRVSVNFFTTPGFFILATAMVCYLFRRKSASIHRDWAASTRRSWRTLATLAVGSATVYLMVDSGQIQFLGRVIARGGTFVYSALYPLVSFLGGMAFGQGLPGNFLFSRMQVSISPMLGIPLAVLVGIVVVVTMGPTNALKPTQIAYTSSLANVKGRDGEIFRICLRWQLLQLAAAAIGSVILVLLWR